ncbi:MAG: SPFH domain-containing protein, partial [Planctomycetota bacterium]
MTISSKRAEYISRISLVWSVVCFVSTLLIGLWSGFFGVEAISWLILGSVVIWLVLCLHFHQRSLAEQERLDASELARGKEGSTIFRSSDDRGVLFDAAGRRLVTFEKWFLPIFSALIAVYQLAMGVYLFRKASFGVDYGTQYPLVVAVGLTLLAFLSFLLARYATGMSVQQQWKPLKAGGSFLQGIAVLCFGLAIAFALVQFQYPIFKDILNWVIPILMVILGIEGSLNVVFDIYRPRLKAQYQKSAFDSRLLGLISEPGGIFRTAASAIDYQFGFKVSGTWFYKLLMEKAIVPLVLFSAAILYFLSCIVTVAPEEEAIIEHFGSPVTASGEKRIVGPGLTWKWPWPIDIAYKYPTQKISQINIGFEEEPEEEESHEQGHGPLLWGKSHYHEEYSLLVASESSDSSQDDESVPVSMVIAAVPVQYRVKDLYAFFYNYGQVEEISGRDRRKVYQSE